MAESQGTQPAFLSAPLEATVLKTLEDHAEDLTTISNTIWSTPELCFKETKAVALLTTYLKDQGFTVTQPFGGLDTAFLAEFQTAHFDPEKDPTVAVLCEYDALPELGHACGHNLISEAGLGTFLAVVAALKTSTTIEGKMVCMGTPAEEGGGGKVVLIQAGAFDKVDFAMMCHPGLNILEPDILGIDHCYAEFFGKASHASCGPWEGINALDAAVAGYNNVSMLRQQLKPGHQIHVTIEHGGDKPNVIPEYTKLLFYVRAPTAVDLRNLRTRVKACLQAGATATGCRVEYGFNEVSYSALMSNKGMLSVFKHYGEKQGTKFQVIQNGYGSTDMGDVSSVVPSIHPSFFVGDCDMIHTPEFQVIAGKPEAHTYARKAAAAMAMTSLELFTNPKLRDQVREEFVKKRDEFLGTADETDGVF